MTINKLHQFILNHPDLLEKVESKAYSHRLNYGQRHMYLKFLERIFCYDNQRFDTDWFHKIINRNVFSWENRYPLVNCRNWYRKDWSKF